MLMMGGQFMPQAALPPGMFPPGAFTQSGPAWDQAAAQQHMASLHAFLAQYAAASAAAAGGQGGAPPPHWPYAPGELVLLCLWCFSPLHSGIHLCLWEGAIPWTIPCSKAHDVGGLLVTQGLPRRRGPP